MQKLRAYINRPVSIAPLVVFRGLFGFIMLVSIIRFAAKGWIYELYVMPEFHFTYYGFEWVQPLGEFGMYGLFVLMGVSALFIMLGYHYKVAAVLFFLSFTYVELIDKANYLNHYYFVSLVSFLMILVPANRRFSIDALQLPEIRASKVPAWTIDIFKFQLAVVYIFAGIAKLNYDWLFNAMPLSIWLPAQSHFPLIGPLFEYEATAYFFSWAGAFYDLFVVFFLLWRKTRPWAYAAVIVFHMMTWMLFQIGMFPFIMILSTLIFFSAEFHEKLIGYAKKVGRFVFSRYSGTSDGIERSWVPGKTSGRVLAAVLGVYVMLQVLIPLRFVLYPGNLFWNEEGYRFSWRVMLMEKAGYAVFTVHDPESGRSWEVPNWEYLTPNQEKMMATQPDMILQFVHFLEEEYRKKGYKDVQITAQSYVTLNGRRSRPMLDETIDLTAVKPGLAHKKWVLPYNNESMHSTNMKAKVK